MTILRGESADPLQPASWRPGQFSAQRSYKVCSDEVSVAGIRPTLVNGNRVEVDHPHVEESDPEEVYRRSLSSILI